MNADKLIGRMAEHHITREKLAGLIGISVPRLTDRLKGRYSFSLSEVVKIGEVLNMTDADMCDIFLHRNTR